jgi:hypothetical protein
MAQSELKACPTPWCDGTSEDLLVHLYPRGWVVQCLICGVKSPFATTRADAVELWNTRAEDKHDPR